MAQRTWDEKEKAYEAKHAAYVKGWNGKDAAFKAKEEADMTAFHKAEVTGMNVLGKETIKSGRVHAAAISAYNKT